MKRVFSAILFALLLAGFTAYAQEEESAELFLEAYTDTFQETFFEALKEKGIENYDRAQELLMKCKEMEPNNPVLDHELAKVLVAAGQPAAAEPYALAAVTGDPQQYWHVHVLMQALEAQHKDPEAMTGILPLERSAFRMNLAQWYVNSGDGTKALAQLELVPLTPPVKVLRARAMQLQKPAIDPLSETEEAPRDAEPVAGSLEDYRNRAEVLLASGDWSALEKLSAEAVEYFPLQPYFYYTRGKALLGSGKAAEAVSALKLGEELLLDNGPVARQLYEALAEAYAALGKTEEENRYREKLKSGL